MTSKSSPHEAIVTMLRIGSPMVKLMKSMQTRVQRIEALYDNPNSYSSFNAKKQRLKMVDEIVETFDLYGLKHFAENSIDRLIMIRIIDHFLFFWKGRAVMPKEVDKLHHMKHQLDGCVIKGNMVISRKSSCSEYSVHGAICEPHLPPDEDRYNAIVNRYFPNMDNFVRENPDGEIKLVEVEISEIRAVSQIHMKKIK